MIGIDGVDSLAAQAVVKYGTVKNTATEQFFKHQTAEPFVSMYKFMQKEGSNVPTTSTGIDMVRDSFGKSKGNVLNGLYVHVDSLYVHNYNVV